jgi:hypothetical protein
VSFHRFRTGYRQSRTLRFITQLPTLVCCVDVAAAPRIGAEMLAMKDNCRAWDDGVKLSLVSYYAVAIMISPRYMLSLIRTLLPTRDCYVPIL